MGWAGWNWPNTWAEAGTAPRQRKTSTAARRFMASPRESDHTTRVGGGPQLRQAGRPPVDRQGSERAAAPVGGPGGDTTRGPEGPHEERSEEHTSELQSQSNLVCRLLL